MASIYNETQEYWRSAFVDCWGLAATPSGIPTILFKRIDPDFRVLYLILRGLLSVGYIDIDNISHLRLSLADLHIIALIAKAEGVDIIFVNRQMILN
jgi:hypothetical protein